MSTAKNEPKKENESSEHKPKKARAFCANKRTQERNRATATTMPDLIIVYTGTAHQQTLALLTTELGLVLSRAPRSDALLLLAYDSPPPRPASVTGKRVDIAAGQCECALRSALR